MCWRAVRKRFLVRGTCGCKKRSGCALHRKRDGPAGIAGEDDLDPPDLLSPVEPQTKARCATKNEKDRINGGQGQSVHQVSGGQRAKAVSASNKSMLEPEPSAALRDQLTMELQSISSAEGAANWAHRVIGAKNSLTAADAKRVEQDFQSRLALVTKKTPGELLASKRQSGARPVDRSKKCRRVSVVDKSALALATPRRIRDRNHVKSVAKQPCLVCGRRPADTHHLRFAQSPALGRKVSDEFTVPLCRGHHREVHRCGDEAGWWGMTGIDPIVVARALWLKTHPLPNAMDTRFKVQNEANLQGGTS
jgi:hypothetical protein